MTQDDVQEIIEAAFDAVAARLPPDGDIELTQEFVDYQNELDKRLRPLLEALIDARP